MENLVLKSLAKLRKACTRSHRELRDVIDAAQAKVAAAVERGGQDGASSSLEVPFEPFLLACLTRYAKLVAVALDCMEKFLAFGFLRGAGAIPEGVRRRLVQKAAAASSTSGRRSGLASLGLGSSQNASSSASTFALNTPSSGRESSNAAAGDEDGNEDSYRLIDCIVEVACDCNDHPDEGVQIQVLRVLLTAVTTPTCEVHEHALLRAVRACYHVHLVSKSTTNRTVAKATLQQIISIVFQRMETFDRRVEAETKATLQASLDKQTQQQQEQERELQEASDSADSSEEDGDTGSLLAAPTAVWYPSVASALQLAVPFESMENPSTSPLAKPKSEQPAAPTAPMFAPAFPSVLHKDAFLLFRSLCRISMRSVADDSPLGGMPNGSNGSMTGAPGATGNGSGGAEDPFAFQSKLLSLDLVKNILENAGPSFRRGERFVHA
ncbi:hypothetical protein BBJ28_00018766, partial [Nothophytophthora sp. Chile5]